MKKAISLSDLAGLEKSDIFDLEETYVNHVTSVSRDDRGGVFHPSAVDACARRSVYEYTRVPRDYDSLDDDQSLDIFDVGHAVHDLIQGRLEALEGTDDVSFRFTREVPYDPVTDRLLVDFGIGGTCDGILEVLVKDTVMQRMVVEIKSIKDKNFHDLSGPKEGHVWQSHLYAYRFDCPIIVIWYFNKNTSERRLFPLVFDHKKLMEALKRFEDQLKHVDAGTLPDREENWFMCPRCSWRKTCNPSVNNISKGRNAKKMRLNIKSKTGGRLSRLPGEEHDA
jgi:CRISPR/Cas system-associated exonuclease Cas4 (RecB family)